jgi:hypothetical protein
MLLKESCLILTLNLIAGRLVILLMEWYSVIKLALLFHVLMDKEK